MLDYSEKRDFQRMNMGCPARYRPNGAAQAECAVVDNLSGSGVALITEKAVAPDIQMSLEIMPGKTITPPLSAYVRVLRCDPRDDGNFQVVCTIERILGDAEVGPDFP
jgi:hypothetical protein